MKILVLHARQFKYETREKALKRVPDPPGSYECSNCLVVLVTMEDGDDEYSLVEAVGDILDVAGRVSASVIVVYPYAHLSSRLAKPETAYSLTVKLAELLKEKASGATIHRAPFGWYKRFMIDVYGHPLSELSREIRGRELLYIADDGSLTLEDALRKGYLPDSLEGGLYDELLDILERFGLIDLRENGLYIISKMTNMILYRLGIGFNSISIVYDEVSYSTGIKGVKGLIRKCANLAFPDKAVILLGNGFRGSIIAVAGKVDLEGFVKGISEGMLNSVSDLPLGENRILVGSDRLTVKLYIYSLYNRSALPLGVYVRHGDIEKTCIGPVYNFIVSFIDTELAKAKQGKTPMMPIWMHPYHVAVIPVSINEVEYAEDVIDKLRLQGARVYPLLNVRERLGSRIRAAARNWIPYIVVIGRREVETGTLTVRRRWLEGRQEAITLEELLEEIRVAVSSDPTMLRLTLRQKH